MGRTFLRSSSTFESYSRRGLFGLVASGSLAALLPGCGTLDRGSPVPRTATLKASVLGFPNERFFPMIGTDPLEAEFDAALQRRRRGLSPNRNDARDAITRSFGRRRERGFRRRSLVRVVRAPLASDL